MTHAKFVVQYIRRIPHMLISDSLLEACLRGPAFGQFVRYVCTYLLQTVEVAHILTFMNAVWPECESPVTSWPKSTVV